MKTVSVRLSEEEYGRLEQEAMGETRSVASLIRAKLALAVLAGGAGAGVRERMEGLEGEVGGLQDRVRHLELDAAAYQRDLAARIVSESQRIDRLEQMVAEAVNLATANTPVPQLPPGMTHRPDPLAGLVPPVSESRVAPRLKGRGKKAKAEGCKRCEEGCVPDICCCGCHRKERAA